jgi:hypothetical protein
VSYEHDDGKQSDCESCGELLRKPKNAMPLQPMGDDGRGVIRFRPNRIVQHLLDNGPFDLNDVAFLDVTNAEQMQFAQLIGYSVSGASSLSYFDDETREEMLTLSGEAFHRLAEEPAEEEE